MTDSQMKILVNIIGAVESGGQIYGNRNYSAYAAPYTNSDVEHTCTLGWAQNYGNEGRRLCQMIFNRNTTSFRNADTANIESKLNVDWVSTRWNPSAAEKKALVAIITTATGKQCQDELFEELMETYIKKALEFDSTMSVQAQMMWCEIAHLGGINPAKRIFTRASKPYTVDTIYNSLLKDKSDYNSNNQVGDEKFQSRHECCVKWINQYVGKENSTTLHETQRWVGKVTADKLNVRTWAGKENPLIKSYPYLEKGNLVGVCDSVKADNNNKWYYILIANKYHGFVNSKYIERQ